MVDRTEGLLFDIGQGYSALDAQAARDRLDGYAVVSGLGVSVDTDLFVSVASGTATVGDDGSGGLATATLGSTTSVELDPADTEDPRKDTVYLDATGTVQVETGFPNAGLPSNRTRFETYQPEPPRPSTEGVILAEVWVAAQETTLVADDIRDRRQPATIRADAMVADSATIDTLTVESTSTVDDETVQTLTLGELKTLEPAAEPATPGGDDVAVWNDTNAIKAKFSDGTTATITQE